MTHEATNNARRAMPCWSRKRRPYGGTLLEILISLVVLALIMQLLTDVSSRMRATRGRLREEREGVEAVLQWRAAASAAKPWTQGEAGEFPDHVTHWQLTHVNSDPRTADAGPDGKWRCLILRRDGDDPLDCQAALRLTDVAVPQSTTRPAPPKTPAGQNGGR